MSRISWGLVGISIVASGCFGALAVPDQTVVPTAGSTRPVSLAVLHGQALPQADKARPPQRALVDRYCVTCHNERLRTAGLALDRMDVERIGGNAEVWEKVARKLRSGTMPPAGLPRPDSAAAAALASSLETALDRAAAANPNPGRPAVHRLNRAEYTNAIRDLLGMEVDGRALLPADDSGYGFDNIADVLSVSPGLLERYMSAAVKISRLAIGDPTIRPVVETYKVSPVLVQEGRMSEELSFGTRGGIAIRHNFPLDGEYVLTIRLQRTYTDMIRGLADSNEIDVRLDRARIKLFTIGGKFSGGRGDQTPAASFRERQDYQMTADRDLEVRFTSKAGPHVVGVAFADRPFAPEGVLRPLPSVKSFEYAARSDFDPAVDSIQMAGPYSAAAPDATPSRDRIFLCRPASSREDEECAAKILATLARRAYRRPATDADLQTLLPFYRAGRTTGGFEAGLQSAIERILIDPDFLFRIEREPAQLAPGAAYRLSDVELASRLSFFLWSSIPDDELLALAERDKLQDATVLEQQVRRMLADARSQALVTNFAGQWLYLRNTQLVSPDPTAFPEFDDNLREAFQQETELFFASIIREDRSVVDLLSADYTFLNERLARHYQIPNIYGNHFRRVTLTDTRRGGLLGQGSILTVTSYAHRTSPVKRGKWILENILGAPPPPPPANVPALKENAGGAAQALSVRARMEQHRANPVCASCHAQLDPLGFGLENFDAVGRWRNTTEANDPVDARGTLQDGTKFDGPAELRQLLLGRREQFATTVTQKLLTYAVGRGLEHYDAPAVRKVVREADSTGYRWSALVLGIVNSAPFQLKTAQGQ